MAEKISRPKIVKNSLTHIIEMWQEANRPKKKNGPKTKFGLQTGPLNRGPFSFYLMIQPK